MSYRADGRTSTHPAQMAVGIVTGAAITTPSPMACMAWPVRRLQMKFHAALSCLRAAVRPSGSAAAPGGASSRAGRRPPKHRPVPPSYDLPRNHKYLPGTERTDARSGPTAMGARNSDRPVAASRLRHEDISFTGAPRQRVQTGAGTFRVAILLHCDRGSTASQAKPE
jgi:hypothetical protein